MHDIVAKPYIFTDEPEEEMLVLDFDNYATTISDIILESDPQFTIGVFGKWGSGKTTLLKKINTVLHSKRCTTLQFNAWRFEQEVEHAKIPLMFGIINTLYSKLENEENQKTSLIEKQNIKNQLIKRTKNFLSSWSITISTGIPGIVNIEAKSSKKTKGEKQKSPEITKSPLQEGFDLIEKLLDANSDIKNKELRLIILIDDLDRCSPEKVLQVFESIKIFFNMKGIVFVLGLSNEIVENAIKEKYKHFENKFSGKEYLEKIIQLPFHIPIWEPKDIKDYLNMLIQQHPDRIYQKIFNENLNLITNASEHNPREIKRYLNNFILSKYMNKYNSNLDDKKMLILSAIYMRWKWFLDAFFADLDLLKIKSLLTNKTSEHTYSKYVNESIEEKIMKDKSLVQFLQNEGQIIFDMSDTEVQEYKRISSRFLATLKTKLSYLHTEQQNTV